MRNPITAQGARAKAILSAKNDKHFEEFGTLRGRNSANRAALREERLRALAQSHPDVTLAEFKQRYEERLPSIFGSSGLGDIEDGFMAGIGLIAGPSAWLHGKLTAAKTAKLDYNEYVEYRNELHPNLSPLSTVSKGSNASGSNASGVILNEPTNTTPLLPQSPVRNDYTV